MDPARLRHTLPPPGNQFLNKITRKGVSCNLIILSCITCFINVKNFDMNEGRAGPSMSLESAIFLDNFHQKYIQMLYMDHDRESVTFIRHLNHPHKYTVSR